MTIILRAVAVLTSFVGSTAYAAAAEEGRGLPLSLILALLAVFICVGVVIAAASQKKK